MAYAPPVDERELLINEDFLLYQRDHGQRWVNALWNPSQHFDYDTSAGDEPPPPPSGYELICTIDLTKPFEPQLQPYRHFDP